LHRRPNWRGICSIERARVGVPLSWFPLESRSANHSDSAGAAAGLDSTIMSHNLLSVTDRESSVPALRASDAERERAAELLRDAMTSGRLAVDELDERMQLVFAATTREELERLVDDVLVPAEDNHPLASGSTPLTDRQARLPVREGSDGTGRILSIFSGSERKGRWRVAASCSVVNVFGGSEIDLSQAELAADRVELKIVSVFGGAQVIVPPGLNVEISDVAVLAGNEIDVGDECPDRGGPTVRLRLISILSGTKVTRKRDKELGRRRRPLELGTESND
jgi:hypothetical protein